VTSQIDELEIRAYLEKIDRMVAEDLWRKQI
jgi:hypothetical protein